MAASACSPGALVIIIAEAVVALAGCQVALEDGAVQARAPATTLYDKPGTRARVHCVCVQVLEVQATGKLYMHRVRMIPVSAACSCSTFTGRGCQPRGKRRQTGFVRG
jgi:hypothetical protein